MSPSRCSRSRAPRSLARLPACRSGRDERSRVLAPACVVLSAPVVPDRAAPLAEVRSSRARSPSRRIRRRRARTAAGGRRRRSRRSPDGGSSSSARRGRLIGLVAGRRLRGGDIRAHLNQGINLVNNCYAKVVLRRGHVLLHASAVTRDGTPAVLAGPPGAGKSTSALHLVEAGFHCLSNDRVLASPMPALVEALGYPKQPRVNPGTLLGHPRPLDACSIPPTAPR